MAFLKRLFRRNSLRQKASDRTIQEQHAELLRAAGMSTAKRMLINEGEDDEMEIIGYKIDKLRSLITYALIVATCGFLRLFFHWVPHWYLYATSKMCPVTEARTILIVEVFKGKHNIYHVKQLKVLTSDSVLNMKNNGNESHVIDPQLIEDLTEVQPSLGVHFGNGDFKELDKLLLFNCKKVSYIWNPDSSKFDKLRGLDVGVSCHKFHDSRGLSTGEAFMRRVVYGSNKIHIEESSILKLLFLEVLNPFFIFQIASFLLWFLDNYYYYACAIMLMSTFGISMTVIQIKKNERNLRATVHSSDVCKVLRKASRKSNEEENFVTETISTEFLVPGDILEIPAHGCVMHCDALLLTGNCILNESMLTGESVPVTKTSLPNIKDVIYDPKEHSKHTLFCGTQVIQTRYFGSEKVLAIVVRTGFSTAKGSLVRSILYPPPVDFKFEKDSYKFVACMAGIATIGFIYTVFTKLSRGVPITDIILGACDLITIVIPPALPAAMTVGCFYAQIRLKKNQIFCISPRSINVSGSVNCVCFDKTGTLTEDGLDLLCVVSAEGSKFSEQITEVNKMPYNTLFFGLVSCHSLTIIDKQIVGDPLDLKMFESTKWIMEEPEVADNNKFDLIFPTVLRPPKGSTDQIASENIDDQPLQIGIIREFPFSSSLQRMGVVIRKLNAPNFEYYCKGSPEMLLNFIDQSSLPHNFHEVLENYTQDGCRVIAIAHKVVRMSYAKIQKIQREVLEKDMTFLGLIVLENRLKPETTACIQALNEANVRIIMVTGDNILTALSVAKDCDIIKPGESVITVNADNNTPPQLYYTLNNVKSKNANVLSNSASVVSLDTMESQIQSSITMKVHKFKETTNLCNNYRFAMTGKVWSVIKEYYSDELLAKLVTRGTIFARMSPEQKQQLVQELQGLGYYVAMCGDGANDCGALKAAHTGVSLSDAESSVASPFTSKNANISCVINVIKEGRAALVTSFGIFKYMAAYSLCQFMSVLILYEFDSNLTDMEFLYIDLFIISLFAFFFGKTDSYPGKLVEQPPLTSLISLSPILSLTLQLILIVVFQIGSFWYLSAQSWYHPFNHGEKFRDDVMCLENYTIFSISSFQYITLAIIFSKGKPYRKTIFTNIGFLITAIVLVVVSTYLTLIPDKFSQTFFQLEVPDDFQFRSTLIIMAGVYFILSFVMEKGFIELVVFKRSSKKIDKSSRYVSIEHSLSRDTKWPPLISTTDFTTAASPENTIPTCTAEIVVEKINKFDKNHVLNKLYNNSNRNSVELIETSNSGNEAVSSGDKLTITNGDKFNSIENSFALKTISENNLNMKIGSTEGSFIVNDTNLNVTPGRCPKLNNFRFESNLKKNKAQSEDLYSSVTSNYTKSGSSESDTTFKSFSPILNDGLGSNCNITELPYDEDDEKIRKSSDTLYFTSELGNGEIVEDQKFDLNKFDDNR